MSKCFKLKYKLSTNTCDILAKFRIDLRGILFILFVFNFSSCETEFDIDVNSSSQNNENKLTRIDPEIQYQEMIGFGGSITWYCDRISNSPKKDEIIHFIVDDLGIDVLRLKNWYYPLNYPINKEPTEMEISWFRQHFEATNWLNQIIKSKNPDIRVILSSWGPPSFLKDNGKLDHGSLKKENGQFMYEEFTHYWWDVMEHIDFAPDYVSIQNEPTWLADWETCEWGPNENSSLPSYEIAFNQISEIFKNLDNPPKMIGPESANLSEKAFDDFAEELKSNPKLDTYAYHPYNFDNNSSFKKIRSTLRDIHENFPNKKKMMTEYSGMDWLKTALFINSNLRDAHASAYLYWQLMWAEDSEEAMIKVGANGDFELTKFYHLLKHYSKYTDIGYYRIDIPDEEEGLDQIAFKDPNNNRITLITINYGNDDITCTLSVQGHEVTQLKAYQSLEDYHFSNLTINAYNKLVFKAQSITTSVLSY